MNPFKKIQGFRKFSLKPLVCIGLMAMSLQGCISDEEPKGAELVPGDFLPQFEVILNTGQSVSSNSLKGKTAMIVFFNTNCPDCQKELPVVQEIWNLYQADPSVSIVLIAREEEAEEIELYWKEMDLTMPYSPQKNRDIYSLFAASIIPRIYIADPSGQITVAFTDNPLPSLQTLLNELQNASSTL